MLILEFVQANFNVLMWNWDPQNVFSFYSIEYVSAEAQGLMDDIKNGLRRIVIEDFGKKIFANSADGASTNWSNGVLFKRKEPLSAKRD